MVEVEEIVEMNNMADKIMANNMIIAVLQVLIEIMGIIVEDEVDKAQIGIIQEAEVQDLTEVLTGITVMDQIMININEIMINKIEIMKTLG